MRFWPRSLLARLLLVVLSGLLLANALSLTLVIAALAVVIVRRNRHIRPESVSKMYPTVSRQPRG